MRDTHDMLAKQGLNTLEEAQSGLERLFLPRIKLGTIYFRDLDFY